MIRCCETFCVTLIMLHVSPRMYTFNGIIYYMFEFNHNYHLDLNLIRIYIAPRVPITKVLLYNIAILDGFKY
jgi:hypothetical protein